jgi:UPF0716 protein FxsA
LAFALVLVVLPVIDVVFLWKVGHRIGVAPTLGLMFAMAFVGYFVARAAGSEGLRQLQGTRREGRSPETRVISNFLLLLAGLLFAWPGAASDVAGLLLLVRPFRERVARYLRRRWERGVKTGFIEIEVNDGFGVSRWQAGTRTPPPRFIDVDGRPVEEPREWPLFPNVFPNDLGDRDKKKS